MQSSIDTSEVAAKFKLLLLGDEQVGKTSFINRYKTPNTEKKKVGSSEIEVSSIRFATSYGVVEFNIWEAVGKEGYANQPEEFYTDADCVILMFDCTSRVTYKNTPNWFKEVTKRVESIPIVMIGNKFDAQKDIRVKPKQITFHRKRNFTFFAISAKANYNWEAPFISLLRSFLDLKNLSISNH